MQRPTITIYTDGSNRGQPGPAGWGAILVHEESGHTREMSGQIPSATNQVAELMGPIVAIRSLRCLCNVRVVSDSQYVVNGINQWLASWAAKGWYAPTGPLKNKELWQELWRLMSIHAITAEWVRGHNGHPMNERADELAGSASAAEKERQEAINV